MVCRLALCPFSLALNDCTHVYPFAGSLVPRPHPKTGEGLVAFNTLLGLFVKFRVSWNAIGSVAFLRIANNLPARQL